MTHMIYRVVVLCEGWADTTKTNPVSKKEAVLVDAVSTDAAMNAGRECVEFTADMWTKWTTFEAIECAECRLPILVKNI